LKNTKSKFEVGDLCQSSGFKFKNKDKFYFVIKDIKIAEDIIYDIILISCDKLKYRDLKQFTENSWVGQRATKIV